MLRHHPLDQTTPETGPTGRAASGDRSGSNPIERKAVARVRHEIAAMPASLVVQLALWPDEIAAWARAEGTSESLVYNMLARRKPYHRVRERLAERLEVPTAVLAHLVDARRPLPAVKRDPALAATRHSAIDWSSPPYPLHRDGTNPVERRAVRIVEREIASMPPSAVVGLALWPTTLAEWSREHRLKSSIVWATLAGSPSERIRADLARRLDVTRRDLDDLIAVPRARPAGERLEGDRSAELSLVAGADEPAPRADGAVPRRRRTGPGGAEPGAEEELEREPSGESGGAIAGGAARSVSPPPNPDQLTLF